MIFKFCSNLPLVPLINGNCSFGHLSSVTKKSALKKCTFIHSFIYKEIYEGPTTPVKTSQVEMSGVNIAVSSWLSNRRSREPAVHIWSKIGKGFSKISPRNYRAERIKIRGRNGSPISFYIKILPVNLVGSGLSYINQDNGNCLTVVPQMKMWDRRTSQICFSHLIIRCKIPA